MIAVRAGLFGRTQLLIGVDEITEVRPDQRRLVIGDPPRLAAASLPKKKR
jgi:hypothetical protein